MIDKEQVLQMVKMKGFVVPSDLVRQFHSDTFIMGAVLSDLVHDKKLGVSTVKIGGSPVYYPPESKEKLLDLVKYLNEKDKATFALLQKQKVLSDTEQTPLVRVSLRALKDYAKPIEVTANSQTKLFWKWYLATDEEVHNTLKTLLVQQSPQSLQSSAPSLQPQPAVEKEKIKQKEERQAHLAKPPPSLAPEAPSLALPLSSPQQLPTDPFTQKVINFFQQKGIVLIEAHLLKKGEVECLVDVPSPVGTIHYFCKAKQKKKCSEGDIATIFVAAQMKKLPALLLTTGEIPKKLGEKTAVEYPNMKILTF